MRDHQVLIVIPAKNEANTITTVLEDIRQHFSGDILVIDDASSDATAALAAEAGAVVLNLRISLGAWGAMQTGLRYAQQQGYQAVITMDADGQHDAAAIPELIAPLQQGICDVVVGAYPQRGSQARQFAWRLFRWITGLQLDDLTSGLRAYNVKAIHLLASGIATLLDYQDVGVLMLLQRAGLRTREVAITMYPRQDGHSRIFSSWWVVGRYMLQTTILSIALSQRIELKRLLRSGTSN